MFPSTDSGTCVIAAVAEGCTLATRFEVPKPKKSASHACDDSIAEVSFRLIGLDACAAFAHRDPCG